MSRNRAVFLLALCICLGLSVPDQRGNALIILGVGLTIVGGVFLHLLFGPARSLMRRIAAMISDVVTICIVLHLGGESTACFFPLLLWTVFGNGLRFGRRSLLRAMAVAATCFGAVIATTPFWRDHASLSSGLMLSLIMLPLYSLSLLDRLSIAKRQAEAADAAKSMFLASVSHEMRTPLHAIVAMGSLLERSHLPDQIAGMVRTMMDASERMLEYINDLLSLTKRDAAQAAGPTTEFPVVGMLTSAIAMSRPQAEAKNLSIRLHVSPRVPLRARASERHIRQVLLNLLSNALKFTQCGGILVSVDAVASTDGAMRLIIEVTDTGIGIAEHALEKVFEPFAQGSPQIMEQFGGTGLGLAICKKIVEGLGGTIGARPDQGGGATVWFEAPLQGLGSTGRDDENLGRITVVTVGDDAGHEVGDRLEFLKVGAEHIRDVPLEVALGEAADRGQPILLHWDGVPTWHEATSLLRGDPSRWPICVLVGDPSGGIGKGSLRWLCETWVPEDFTKEDLAKAVSVAKGAHSPTVPVRRQVRPQGRPLSVLVADDNKTNQLVMAKMLEAGGHSHTLVNDGQAALTAMKSGLFDIVLMDVNMPGMNGLEATKRYRETAVGEAWLPIIGLTADVTDETEIRCKAAGMNGRLLKPVGTDDLLATLESAAAPREISSPANPPADRDASDHEDLLDDQHLALLKEAVGATYDTFIQDLMRNFFLEVSEALTGLHGALLSADWERARAQAHTLASCSASVGATRIRHASLTLEQSIPGILLGQALLQAASIESHVAATAEEWANRNG